MRGCNFGRKLATDIFYGLVVEREKEDEEIQRRECRTAHLLFSAVSPANSISRFAVSFVGFKYY